MESSQSWRQWATNTIEYLIQENKRMSQSVIDLQTQVTTLQGNLATLVTDVAAYMQQESAAIAALQSQLAANPSDDPAVESAAQSLATFNATMSQTIATLAAALPANTGTGTGSGSGSGSSTDTGTGTGTGSGS